MLEERLKQLRKQHGYTQSTLAALLGLTQQAIGKWEKGASTPEPGVLMQLAELYGVSLDTLLGRSTVAARPVQPYHPAMEALVPIVGSVRAGYGALAFEEDHGAEPAAVRDPENYFYLVVKGDSMEPRIRSGDLALVRRQPALDDGDLGVGVSGEGEGTLKRFQRKGSAVVLQPFNPAYEPLILAGEELDHLYIAGKVVETKARW